MAPSLTLCCVRYCLRPLPRVHFLRARSCERTFRDIKDPTELRMKCSELSLKLAGHLARLGLECACVTLKLKTASFVIRSRAAALCSSQPTSWRVGLTFPVAVP